MYTLISFSEANSIVEDDLVVEGIVGQSVELSSDMPLMEMPGIVRVGLIFRLLEGCQEYCFSLRFCSRKLMSAFGIRMSAGLNPDLGLEFFLTSFGPSFSSGERSIVPLHLVGIDTD